RVRALCIELRNRVVDHRYPALLRAPRTRLAGAFGHRLLDHAERRVDRDNEIDWLLRILREANRATRRHRRHVWLCHPHNERLTKLEALADWVFRLVGLLERSDGALQLL